jgi:hypothetical protein
MLAYYNPWRWYVRFENNGKPEFRYFRKEGEANTFAASVNSQSRENPYPKSDPELEDGLGRTRQVKRMAKEKLSSASKSKPKKVVKKLEHRVPAEVQA